MTVPERAVRHRPRQAVALRILPAFLLIALAVAGPWLAPHTIDTPVTAPYAEPGGGTPSGATSSDGMCSPDFSPEVVNSLPPPSS